MKALISSLILAMLVSGASGHEVDSPANRLSAAEKKAGWKLLFDGESLNGWRSYRKTDGPTQGWVVENGILKCVAKGRGGDIVSTEQFTDFDLRWEWMIPAKANNGLKYMVDEKRPTAPGQEYQMLDDATETKDAKRTTASFYDVIAPDPKKPLNPVGTWNESRILVKGNHVEHWLNGKKVLAYELGSAAVKAAVAASKFKDAEHFGEKITGPIMLTEHRDEASYKNIKIRELKGGQ